MNDFMKMLVLSCASIMIITSYGSAEQSCVRPVQGFISLGLYGAQSKIDGTFSKLNKLDATTLDQLLKLSGGKLKISGISQDDLKNVAKITVGTNKPEHFDDNNGNIELIEVPGPGAQVTSANAFIKPTLTITPAGDGQSINIVQKNDFHGENAAGDGIVPKLSKFHQYYYKADGGLAQGDRTDAITPAATVNNANIPFNNTVKTVYDEKYPAPTISNIATLSYDLNKLPNAYQITLSDTSDSSNSSWTGKKWQMAGFANLGLLANFSQGGAWYLSVFGAKPFVNHTQTITFGGENSKSSKDSNNNNTGIEAKEKWSLGIETGLRCNITEKVYLGVGGGVQWSWYEFSLKDNSENKNNNDSNTMKQDMKGTAPFLKLSLGFNINKNFGIEIFGKYTGKHDLKYKDGKKSKDDNSSNSSEWPVNFTKQGSPQFGIAASFTF